MELQHVFHRPAGVHEIRCVIMACDSHTLCPASMEGSIQVYYAGGHAIPMHGRLERLVMTWAVDVQVDRDANLVNAYVSPTRPGRVELENLGNLASIKRIPIEGIADIQLQEDGKVMWAFDDVTEPLAINPLALVQKDEEVRRSDAVNLWCHLMSVHRSQGDIRRQRKQLD